MDHSVPINLRDLAVEQHESKMNISNSKQSFYSWLWLMALTVISVLVGAIIDNQSLFILVVLFIVFLKGQQIVDVFMELRHAPRIWRQVMLGYVVIVPAIISVIYLL